jgi:hypothetical protein
LNDKDVLARSHAGIRLIAIATLFNRGDFDRLSTYMTEHFNSVALQVESVDSRLEDLRGQFAAAGKVRVLQVIAYDPHHVVVMLEGQTGQLMLEDLQVEEEYPHKISAHLRQMISDA